MSTIAAIATGPAAGGIGILRISGPAALSVAHRLAPGLTRQPSPRRAYFTPFVDASGAILDEGLTLYFPAPHSYTGEDVVELQAHGSPRLLSMLLAHALSIPEVRLATPGEFTRRAFLAGRIDLARAEAVADLIAAESEAQVRSAAAQLRGELSERLEALHQPMLSLQADIEGSLDFPEETEDAELVVAPRLDELLANARSLLGDARRGALLRRGARVVLFGPVNAGKSTLFNALVGASRALVDAEPGTTRDTLEAKVELGGLAVTLVDTAGLRDDAGRVEALGIERTREAVKAADLAVLVLPPGASDDDLRGWTKDAPEAWVIEGKADQRSGTSARLSVSGLTGVGIAAMRAELVDRLSGDASGAIVSASARHLSALETVVEALVRARAASDVATLEVVAGEVGTAVNALAEVTGADASTELLDAIFQRFCIGK